MEDNIWDKIIGMEILKNKINESIEKDCLVQILEKISEIEEFGMKKLISEEKKSERKKWEIVVKEAYGLSMTIYLMLLNKKRKEEKVDQGTDKYIMSYYNIKKKIKKVEKENVQLTKENEKMKKILATPPIKSFLSLNLIASNPLKIKVDSSVIEHKEGNSIETVLIGDEFTDVCLILI